MIIKRILLTIAMLSLLPGCNGAIKNEEFQRLEPFKATLVNLEEIPCTDESVLSNMTFRDYRVTLRKLDGSIIIVEGVSAIFGDNSNWKDTIPIHMTEVTLKKEEL